MHGTHSTTPRALVFALMPSVAILAMAIAMAIAPARLEAQYFGQNKVTYRYFDF